MDRLIKKSCKALLVCLLCLGMLVGCTSPKEMPSNDTTEATITESTLENGGTDESTVASRDESPDASPDASKEALSASSASSQGVSGGSGITSSQATQPQNTTAPSSTVTKQSSSAKVQKDTIVCTISIDCKTAAGVIKVPGGGTILSSKKVTLKQGATVYDALKASGVGFSGKSYISAIGNVGEGDCGPKSGWMYSVNGKYSNVGCSKYTLSDGDNIRWRYTCNMGADIGA